MKDKKIVTVRNLQRCMAFGVSYAYQLANAEGFPMIKTGRKINILVDKVDAWLEMNIGSKFLR